MDEGEVEGQVAAILPVPNLLHEVFAALRDILALRSPLCLALADTVKDVAHADGAHVHPWGQLGGAFAVHLGPVQLKNMQPV